jgi:hypothetical protein
MTGGRRPHTTAYMSSYYYVCVLILPYMCPHTQKGSSSRRASVSSLSRRRASVTSLSNAFPPSELSAADAQQHAFSPTALGGAGAAGVAVDMNPESPSLWGVRHDSSVGRGTLDMSHALRDLWELRRLPDMRGMSPLYPI